jgi:HAT1-interacting factor 1
MSEPNTETVPPTKEKLVEITNAAALQYSLKNYNGAADLYSEATEIQAELNGEMAPENAELLYLYGRCLFKVAVAKSDVLGGKVAQEEKKKPSKNTNKADNGGGSSAAGAQAGGSGDSKAENAESKPFFQLTGDENWEESDDEDEEGGAEGEEEEDDDFSTAFEILDLTRVLLSRQLEALKDAEGKTPDTPEVKHIKERLADTHDLIAEISLENERFEDAVPDFRSALDLRKELLPLEDTMITEAHYKLSLALEFASMTAIREADRKAEAGEEQTEEAKVDFVLREQAVDHMNEAKASLSARIKKEKEELDSVPEEKRKEKEGSIADAQEMLDEMDIRLADLKADPTKATGNPVDANEIVSGLLSGLIGADAATQKAKMTEAMSQAQDVTGLVRSKKKEKPAADAKPAEGSSTAGNGKRKLEVEDAMNGKRAKTEEKQ